MNVLICGASRGLGLALAKEFLQQGHYVIAGVRAAGGGMGQLLARYPSGLEEAKLDVTLEDDARALAQSIKERGMTLDAVIYNAGVLTERTATALTMGIDALRQTLEVNTVGCAIALKYFTPLVADGGVVIAITSEGCTPRFAGEGYTAYGVSKVAQTHLALCLRAAVKGRVAVYALHPGRVDTDMGHETAQISAGESARGIYGVVTRGVEASAGGYIDYLGRPMQM